MIPDSARPIPEEVRCVPDAARQDSSPAVGHDVDRAEDVDLVVFACKDAGAAELGDLDGCAVNDDVAIHIELGSVDGGLYCRH